MTARMKQAVIGAIAAAAATMLSPTGSIANDFTLEGKTVRWLVGFREGGGTDRLARMLQNKLSETLPGNPTVLVINKPGGGGTVAANQFHADAKPDGTDLIFASTSNFMAPMLGASVVKFDPNEWKAVTGLTRGFIMFGNAEQLGIDRSVTAPKAVLEKLLQADIRVGVNAPFSSRLADLLIFDMLGIKPKVVFGVGTKEGNAAFAREELNVLSDSALTYKKNFADEPNIVPLWSYGFIDPDGNLQRDPDLPDVPTFPEFMEAATGAAPSGLGYELQQSLMNAVVMINKAVMLPPGTPDSIRQVYIDTFQNILSDPEVRANLDRELGHMPVNFGDETTRAIKSGTSMRPEVRDWAENFLQTNYDSSLD